MSSSHQTILIAAGGTGGHIYPALAVADHIKAAHPDIDVHFVGTKSGLENRLVDRYPLHHIAIGRLNKNVSTAERLFTLFKIPLAFVQSLYLIFRLRPKWVFGVGGHASGPVLLMAALSGRKTAIWEPNAMPGLANRILSRFVKTCLVVFDEAKTHLASKNIKTVGVPLREAIEKVPPRRPKAGLNVLVFGGSQGAQALNTAVCEMVGSKEFVSWRERIRLIHQTGAADFDRVKALHAKFGSEVEVLPYINDMEKKYEWADVIISRSGTGTLAELAAVQRTAILIPLPSAADNHQQKNAEALVNAGAARMILQKDLTPQKLLSELKSLCEDEERLQRMANAIGSFHRSKAAAEIARLFF